MLVKIILVTIIKIRLKSLIYILSGSDVLTMLFQLTESLINQYNCTPPWLLYHNNQSEICGPHVSQDAAKKYKQHRYEAYDECENPCEKMFITTLFNSKSPGEQELQMQLPIALPINLISNKYVMNVLYKLGISFTIFKSNN